MDPQNPLFTGRSAVGLADLVALVHRLQPSSPEQLFELARHLGFVRVHAPPSERLATRGAVATVEFPPGIGQPRVSGAEKKKRLRKNQKDDLIVLGLPPEPAASERVKPEWLKAAERTPLEHQYLQQPGVPLSPHEHVVSSAHARALLTTLLSERRLTKNLDVPRLVQRAARALWVDKLPRLRLWRFARRVAVWIESGVSMAPLLGDAEQLVRTLRVLLPKDQLSVARFSTSLEGTTVLRGDGLETVGLGVPDRETVVLVLSRFGLEPYIDSAERIAQSAWLDRLALVAERGFRIIGLTPHEPSAYSSALRAKIQLVKWDERLSVSAAAQARRGHWSRPPLRVPRDSVERLAAAVSLAVDVDQPLLRRARRALVPGADPGVEVELWNGGFVRAADQRRCALEPAHLGLLRDRLSARPGELERAWCLLREAHRSRAPVVQLEEEATFLALGGGPRSEVEEALGRAVLKLRDSSYQWLKSWASFSLQRLPPLALETEAARILSQVVPAGHESAAIAPPRNRDWAQWIGEPARTVGRARRVWIRSVEGTVGLDLELALAPFADARELVLELDREALLVVEDHPPSSAPLRLVSWHEAVGEPLVRELCAAFGERPEVQLARPGEEISAQQRLLLVAPPPEAESVSEAPPPDADFARELERLSEARARFEVVSAEPEGWVHRGPAAAGRTPGASWRGPIERVLLRAIAALADPPRRTQVRLSAAPRRLSGLRGVVTLAHAAGSVRVRRLLSFQNQARALTRALVACERQGAYGLFSGANSSGRLARALLGERHVQIRQESLADLARAFRARRPHLNAVIMTVRQDDASWSETVAKIARQIAAVDPQLRLRDEPIWIRHPQSSFADPLDDALANIDVGFVLAHPEWPEEDRLDWLARWKEAFRPSFIFAITREEAGQTTPAREPRRSWLPDAFDDTDLLKIAYRETDAERFVAEVRAALEQRASPRAAKRFERRLRHRHPIHSAYTRMLVESEAGDRSELIPSGSAGVTCRRTAGSGFSRFVVADSPEIQSLWDPLARQMVQRRGCYWFSAPDKEFGWGADVPIVHPPERLVLYQLHIGTWWSATGRPGTFADATEQLPHLARLGVTGVLLMPVTQTAPSEWPYSPLTPSAIADHYGEPRDLKRLVQQAHRLGIAVYLDVVYDQVAPEAEHVVRFGHGEGLDPAFFPANAKRRDGPWGPRWNFDDEAVRRVLIESALGWFSEFHVDGLYLSGLGSLLDNTLGSRPVGASGLRFLEELVAACRAQYPARLLFGEIGQTPGPALSLGFDGVVAPSFCDSLVSQLREQRDDQRGIDVIERALRRPLEPAARGDGPQSRAIVFSESFDTVQAQSRLPNVLHAQATYPARTALAAVMTLTAAAIPCLYQGQELFELERPQLGKILLGWGELSADADGAKASLARAEWPTPAGAAVQPGAAAVFQRLYTDLIELRLNRTGTTRGLLGERLHVFHTNQHTDDQRRVHRLLAYARGHTGQDDDVIVVLNCSNNGYGSYFLGVPSGGRWHVRLDSRQYVGNEGPHDTAASVEARPQPLHGYPFSVELAVGRYTGLVLSREPDRSFDWLRACPEVSITRGEESVRCTGYLVRPKIVVTPARAAAASGSDVRVRFGQGEWLAARVVARDLERDVCLLELEQAVSGVAPIPLSHSAVPPSTWESVCAGHLVRGPVTAAAHDWTFQRPSDAPAEFAGAPLIYEGQAVGHVPSFDSPSTTMPAVPARAALDLLEELLQMVKIGEVRLPSTDQPAARRFRDREQPGDREVSVAVRFDRPFKQQPQVIVSLQKIDLQDGTPAHIHRLWVLAANVTPEGFDLVFRTWKESIVYDAIATWTAVGE